MVTLGLKGPGMLIPMALMTLLSEQVGPILLAATLGRATLFLAKPQALPRALIFPPLLALTASDWMGQQRKIDLDIR